MDPYDEAYVKAIKFLSFRPRSEKEVRDNLLKKKKYDSVVIERVIATLQRQNFLNDHEFAKWWVNSRKQFKMRAERIIRLELRQKGVAKEIIDESLQIKEDDEHPVQDDATLAEKLVKKQLPRYKGIPKNEVYKKLGGFLARRGFDWETIKRSIDHCMKEEYNTSKWQ
ncbi:MAG: regulatory protein RecX [Candidatus Levybacteria bacterium]|nr:regulatory protein RecX [Candidatus Levybacteria bacterium]